MLISPWIYAIDNTALPEPQETLALAISIDAENLIELYQSVARLQIIESRHFEDHIPGHIETSHRLPLHQGDCSTLSKLAKSGEQAMVFYCNNIAGDASIKVIQVASDWGYELLFWFRSGFVECKDKDYPYVIE